MAIPFYITRGTDTNTTNTTILTVVAGTTTRPEIIYLTCGSDITPAEMAFSNAIDRFTATGTAASAPTVRSNDPNARAALATSGMAHTTEPTYGNAAYDNDANVRLLEWSQNQRGTFQWYAGPNGGLMAPATANNGMGHRIGLVGGTAVAVRTCIHFVE